MTVTAQQRRYDVTAPDPSELAAIAEWHHVTRESFHNTIRPLQQPAVMRGLVSDWPSVAIGRSSDRSLAAYVGDFAPAQLVKAFFGAPDIGGRFFYSDDLQGFNFERLELTLQSLLAELEVEATQPLPRSIYAGAIPLKGELLPLLSENRNPLLDSATEELCSIWIGNRGRTATHWDLPQNIACVVAGARRFTLFPPEQLANLYIGPVDFTLAGQPISLVDLHDPDFQRFPQFRKALEHAQTSVLGPGDAIYIPSMWFHHVETLSPLGVLINFWWRDAAPYMFSPLYTLLHGLLSIRELPPEERARWRLMFDHYLFRADGEPMPYVPRQARGFFGDMTAEKIGRVRATLIRGLGGKLPGD